MEAFTVEALKADRDRAVKQAIKAKVPIFEIAAEFGLSEAEVGLILTEQYGAPAKRPDDIIDARTEKPRR